MGIERRVLWKFHVVGEQLSIIVKLHHASLVNRQGRLDFYVLRQQPGLPVFVRQHHEAINPGWSLPRHLGGFPGKTVFAEGVSEVDAEGRIKPALTGKLRGGERHVEVAQWI